VPYPEQVAKKRWAVVSLLSMSPALLCAAWACSSEPDRPPVLPNLHNDGGDAGGNADAPGPSSCTVEDGGCNTLQNCGSKIYVVQVPADAPTAAGGTLTPGTYVMTAYNVYTGAGGKSGQTGGWFKQTMSFTGDAGVVQSDAGSSLTLTWQEASETSSITAVRSFDGQMSFQLEAPFASSIDFSCPSGSKQYQSPFTATANSLVLFADDGIGKATLTYAKQ
jgi:hypothetical protein